jgi:hypothetical protein
VPQSACGTETGVNTCLKCGDASSYDCEKCCPGTTMVHKGEYSYCTASKGECSKSSPESCYEKVYPNSYLAPGQSTPNCPTGLMFPTAPECPDCYGATVAGFDFEMVDTLKVPALPAGEYSLSWRWDCEQTPQVWNSCADITVTA